MQSPARILLKTSRCISRVTSFKQCNLSKYVLSSYAAITHHEEKVKVRNQIVPMSVSSSYPCGVADRQDARLRPAVRSSAEAKGARLSDWPDSSSGRETPLICLQTDSGTPTDGAARNTPVAGLHGPQVPSRTMCFHVEQIPQHTQREVGGLKPETPSK